MQSSTPEMMICLTDIDPRVCHYYDNIWIFIHNMLGFRPVVQKNNYENRELRRLPSSFIKFYQKKKKVVANLSVKVINDNKIAWLGKKNHKLVEHHAHGVKWTCNLLQAFCQSLNTTHKKRRTKLTSICLYRKPRCGFTCL